MTYLWRIAVGAVALAALGVQASSGLAQAPQAGAKEGTAWVYVGTYTNGKSEGIYLLEMNLATGELTPRGVAAKVKNPSFLAIHPNRRFLYAVNEIADFEGKPAGGVAAFAIDAKTGMLTLLNQQPSGGPGPCHVVVDPSGKNVLVANYGGGSVASLPIDEEGRLEPAASVIQHQGASVNPSRQKEPHAHSINLDAKGRFAFAADLGVDKIFVYKFDAEKGTLTPNDPPSAGVEPGSGPRHFAFHPQGKYAYVINEMSLTVTAFKYDAERGVLSAIQTISTLPPNTKGQGLSTAEVVVHPSGKFLYGSNRGHDTIAVFSIDESTGKLTRVENEPTQGRTPRNFAVDPTGKWLLAENQGSDTIVVFRVNPQTGELDATGARVEVPSPVCVRFLRVGG
jgi:6-phosphogluconolactonase